jgi:hypothetical protein
MMEAVRTSETSVDKYFTRQYIPEYDSELEENVWDGIYRVIQSSSTTLEETGRSFRATVSE